MKNNIDTIFGIYPFKNSSPLASLVYICGKHLLTCLVARKTCPSSFKYPYPFMLVPCIFGLSPLPTDQRRRYKQSQYFTGYHNFIGAGVVLSVVNSSGNNFAYMRYAVPHAWRCIGCGWAKQHRRIEVITSSPVPNTHTHISSVFLSSSKWIECLLISVKDTIQKILQYMDHSDQPVPALLDSLSSEVKLQGVGEPAYYPFSL